MTFLDGADGVDGVNGTSNGHTSDGARKDKTSTFSDNLALPVHWWFRYSEGFSAPWVREVIEREKDQGRRRVFDPFAGSGTVALESERCQVEGIGVEAHPFVARIAQAKLNWRESPKEFTTFALSILEEAKKEKVEREEYPALMGKCFPPEMTALSPPSWRGSPCAPSSGNVPLSVQHKWQYVLKNRALRLMKSLSNLAWPKEAFTRGRIQIRFDSS